MANFEVEIVFELLVLKKEWSVIEKDDCGRGLDVLRMEVNSLPFFLVKLANFVSVGSRLLGTVADVAVDILINELRIFEERLDNDPVAVPILMLSCCWFAFAWSLYDLLELCSRDG
jgi:hypothetical protein